MPIGDLLAQINGEKPTAVPLSLTSQRTAKASSLHPSAKLPQFQPSDDRPALPRHLGQPVAGQHSPRLPKLLHAVTTGRIAKPIANGRGPVVLSPVAASSKEPQKGSYAEILARARRAQAVMGQVGKIQHKPVDRLLIKRERGDPVAAQPSPSLPLLPSPAQKRRGGKSLLGAVGRKTQEEKPVIKIKRAALATLGYTGTARPKPNAKSTKDAPASLNFLQPRNTRVPSSNSRPRHPPEDYDEDMNDFIDDDEDPDDRGKGDRHAVGAAHRYYSDDSDMEAGLDDIDAEERRANWIAAEEDRREEELEQKLKLAKLSRLRRAA